MAFLEEVRKSASGTFDKARLVFNKDPGDDAEEQQPDRLEELAEYCPQLSFQQRLIGFGVSFTLGYMIAFFSFRFFMKLVAGNPIPFAFNYSFGHSCQLLASTFLCGPKRQFKNMFDEKRRITSIVYLSCLGSILVIVFLPLPGAIKLITLLLLTIAQFSASTWYTLSYVPYGRRTLLKFLKRTLGIEESSADYSNVGLGLT